ncbi:hypothetical protein CVT24_005189 [Panaeolus cyanescens]|uniref:Uncharacterized protein n=1 Tax=Panaeolus cyanescens TaxID=181874 RepID=A0A409X4Y4_9AGAR|nr:hypothetical protein CVT24_005189 [Panaeolus cyanescens]
MVLQNLPNIAIFFSGQVSPFQLLIFDHRSLARLDGGSRYQLHVPFVIPGVYPPVLIYAESTYHDSQPQAGRKISDAANHAKSLTDLGMIKLQKGEILSSWREGRTFVRSIKESWPTLVTLVDDDEEGAGNGDSGLMGSAGVGGSNGNDDNASDVSGVDRMLEDE